MIACALRRLVVLACGGVLLSVAVAWVGCVLPVPAPVGQQYLRHNQTVSYLNSGPLRGVQGAVAEARAKCKCSRAVTIVKSADGELCRYKFLWVMEDSDFCVIHWSELFILAEAGWPWRCVWGIVDGSFASFGEPRAMFEREHASGTGVLRLPLGDGAAVVLPVGPRWAGLAADSAVFAVMLAVPVHGWPAARRWRRRCRGQCGHCGYDLGGLGGGVCPECGAARSNIGSESP